MKPARASRRTVVVADDLKGVRRVLRMILEAQGAFHVVAEAADARAAALEASAHKPDLVLLDATMRGNDRLAGLAAVRAASPRSRVFVLAVRIEPELERLAAQLGAEGVLDKGATPSALLERLARASEEGVQRALLE